MKRRTVQPEIRSFFFRCFDPLSRHLTEIKRSRRVQILRRMRTVSKECNVLATESVNSAPFQRGETKVQTFGKESSHFQRHNGDLSVKGETGSVEGEKRKVRIFGKGKCKLIANCVNFWQGKV